MISDQNQNERNPWAGESPTLGSMFSLLENDLDFPSVCMYVRAWWWWYGVCVCVYIYSRSWWVRTRMEREWWLTSQLMTNPYPACNSTPVVRHTCTHTHKHTLKHMCMHIYFWGRNYRAANLEYVMYRAGEWLHFHSAVTWCVFGSHVATSSYLFVGADPANSPKCIHDVCNHIVQNEHVFILTFPSTCLKTRPQHHMQVSHCVLLR